jgi:uncharacterized membrane protein YuzA (DUF378 family)
MTESSQSSASRVLAILMACLTALVGFFAFNVVDGVFGVAPALIGLAACIATTVFVFRRSPSREEDADV